MTLLDHALDYAEKYMRIFPCNTDKTPRTRNGHHDASCDVKQIAEWWRMWPEASIGWALPENVVVIDVDIKHHEGKYGDESLKDWESIHGKLPDTVTSLTGGGGLQLFFSTDKPVKCRTGILPAVDIKTHGGYVILPPSMHPSGRRYEWEVSFDDF